MFSPSQLHIYKDRWVCNPNKQKKVCFAREENVYSSRECLLLCCFIKQRRKQAQPLKMIPKLFLPLAFHSRGLTENISLQDLLFEGRDRLWDQQHCILSSISSMCLDLVRLADVKHMHEYSMIVLTGLST